MFSSDLLCVRRRAVWQKLKNVYVTIVLNLFLCYSDYAEHEKTLAQDYISMAKIDEMTLEELWELFPIFLTEHKPYWSNWYEEEVAALKKIMPFSAEYYHVGSTAVNGIWAKPIIDILIAVKSDSQLKTAADALQNCGYIIMSANDRRISLNKGYTENGFAERVFHLHIRLENDKDEIYFRDYLNTHADVAKEYEKLKLRLWKKYEHDRDGYTDAKTEFIKKYTELAKRNKFVDNV